MTYVNPASVVVSWATGQGNFTNVPLSLSNLNNTYGQYSTVDVKPDTSNKYPVKYGTSATALSTTASGETRTYAQLYTGTHFVALPPYVSAILSCHNTGLDLQDHRPC